MRKRIQRLQEQGKKKEEIKEITKPEWNFINSLSLEENERYVAAFEFAESNFDKEEYDIEFIEKDATGFTPSEEVVKEFLVEKVESGEIDIYVREIKEKDSKLGKCRLDAKKISDDSGISLRSVQRACKKLTTFYRPKPQP